jgi:hypothetical protein
MTENSDICEMTHFFWLNNNFSSGILLYHERFFHKVVVVFIVCKTHSVADLARDGEGDGEVKEIEVVGFEHGVDFRKNVRSEALPWFVAIHVYHLRVRWAT